MLTFEQITDRYSEKAKKSGVDLEIVYDKYSQFQVAYQKGKFDPFQSKTTQTLGFRILKGECEMTSFSESLLQEDLDLVFDEGLESVKYFKKSYHPELVKEAPYKEMDFLYNPQNKQVSVEQKLEQAKLIEESALGVDSRIISVPYQGLVDAETTKSIFNTNGLNVNIQSQSYYIYSYSLAKGDNDTRTASEVQFTRNFNELDAKKNSILSAQKALAMLDAKTPKSGNYPVIFSATTVQSLFGLLQQSFFANLVDKNLSLFQGLLGKTIASPLVQLWDDPFVLLGGYSRPFDDEGVPSNKSCLIEKGELKTYLTNSVYAKKMNLPNTANASRGAKSSLGIQGSNLVLTPGPHSYDQLCGMHSQAIAIESLQGLHSGYDSISGDFSLQGEGFMYKDGKRQHSLANFVISGNMLELLKNVEALGNDVVLNGDSVIAPSMLISNLSIAGN